MIQEIQSLLRKRIDFDWFVIDGVEDVDVEVLVDDVLDFDWTIRVSVDKKKHSTDVVFVSSPAGSEECFDAPIIPIPVVCKAVARKVRKICQETLKEEEYAA